MLGCRIYWVRFGGLVGAFWSEYGDMSKKEPRRKGGDVAENMQCGRFGA